MTEQTTKDRRAYLVQVLSDVIRTRSQGMPPKDVSTEDLVSIRGFVEHWDVPDTDCTDFAHPAWWRGHEHSTHTFCNVAMRVLDGDAKLMSGSTYQPWADTRQRLYDSFQTMLHGKFLYDATTALLDCINGHAELSQKADEGEATQEELDASLASLGEAMQNVRASQYEFMKRFSRVYGVKDDQDASDDSATQA